MECVASNCPNLTRLCCQPGKSSISEWGQSKSATQWTYANTCIVFSCKHVFRYSDDISSCYSRYGREHQDRGMQPTGEGVYKHFLSCIAWLRSCWSKGQHTCEGVFAQDHSCRFLQLVCLICIAAVLSLVWHVSVDFLNNMVSFSFWHFFQGLPKLTVVDFSGAYKLTGIFLRSFTSSQVICQVLWNKNVCVILVYLYACSFA